MKSISCALFLAVLALVCCEGDNASMLHRFAGKRDYATWTYIPARPNTTVGRQQGSAYIDCRLVTEPTLMGEVALPDALTFTVVIWKTGVFERERIVFNYSLQSHTGVPISRERMILFSEREGARLPIRCSLNNTHLVIADSQGRYVIKHAQTTSPLYLVASVVATLFVVWRLLRGWNQTYLQKLGLALLAGKFNVFCLATVATLLGVVELVPALLLAFVMTVVSIIVILFGLFSASLDPRTGYLVGWKMWGILGLSLVEAMMFGETSFQFATYLLLLLLQLSTKYRIPKTRRSNKEDRILVLLFVVSFGFNVPRFVFRENFFRIPPSEMNGLAAFCCCAALLCLLLILPRYQRAPKTRTKEMVLGQCSICVDEIAGGSIFFGECGHCFHTACI